MSLCHPWNYECSLKLSRAHQEYSGFFFRRSLEEALDLKQVTAKPRYTESKFWNTRGLILNVNRMSKAGKIKIAKSTVEKQTGKKNIYGWSNFSLKCVKTRNDSYDEFLGFSSLAKKNLF